MAKNKPLNLRQHRSKVGLTRVTAKLKAPGRRVLIVCEGSKTEPKYFKAIKRDLGISNADVKICGEECGSDPLSVFSYAQDICKEDDGFDEVYCVFDKEGTEERRLNYVDTCARIKAKKVKKGRVFKAIGSVPCFEYWYLLHFRYTTAAFTAQGKKSSGDMVVSALKKELPGYEKSTASVYDALKDKIDKARTNAAKSFAAAEANGSDNPSTEVHILVDALMALKK